MDGGCFTSGTPVGTEQDCAVDQTVCAKQVIGTELSTSILRIFFCKLMNPSSYIIIVKNFSLHLETEGVTVFQRGCAIPEPGAPMKCRELVDKGKSITGCLCNTDLCNISSRIQAPLIMMIIAMFFSIKM